jgi:hypothetical protein
MHTCWAALLRRSSRNTRKPFVNTSRLFRYNPKTYEDLRFLTGSLRFLRPSLLSRKNTDLPPLCQQCNSPLEYHKEPICKPNQKINMHGGPNYPGQESREPHKAQVGQCISPPNDCEVAFVPIPEGRRGWLPSDPSRITSATYFPS